MDRTNQQVADRGSPTTLADGRPLTQVIRRISGLDTVIANPSTEAGIPQGFDPHSLKTAKLYIDPGSEGGGAVLHLGELTSENARRVFAAGRNVMTGDVKLDREAMATEVSRLAAELQKPQPADQPRSQELQITPLQSTDREKMNTHRPRTVSPLSQLNDGILREQREMQAAPTPAAKPAVEPPAMDVVFDIPGFSAITLKYHDVIDNDGFVVLVYDSNWSGGRVTFPPTADGPDPAPIAMAVPGAGYVYSVHTTGVQFAHENWEYCVLTVAARVPLPQEQMEAWHDHGKESGS